MLMLALFRFGTAASRWTLNLVTSWLARALNMPQPLVHDAGVFVLVQVQTIENRVGKALCPLRLMRRLRLLLTR